jgi:hypothetical protein
MQRALQRHEARDARVIPVILQPCDWHNTPFGRLRATPPDGKPIAKYPNVNDAYLAVAQDVRAAAAELLSARGALAPAPTTQPSGTTPERIPQQRSSNLRIKREFTDKERDDFMEGALEYVVRFFENSLSELQSRNPGTETNYRRIDATHFEAAVYTNGRCRAQCRIWLSGRTGVMSGLGYSKNPSPSDSSFNELLSVVDDGFTLGLRAQMHAFHNVPAQNHMTLDGVAEYLWGIFVNPLR